MNVLIIEPDPYRRVLMEAHLSREPDIRVVGVGKSMVGALGSISSPVPVDVVIVNLDAIADMKTWALLRTTFWKNNIVGLTEGRNDRVLLGALAARLSGLLRLNAPLALICQVVRAADQGETYVDSFLAERAKTLFIQPEVENEVRCKGLIIDLDEMAVICRGSLLHLTPMEFRVLSYLVVCKGRIVSSQELLEAVWGSSLGAGGTLDQVWKCISRIRDKIENDPRRPRILRTVRGYGYNISSDIE